MYRLRNNLIFGSDFDNVEFYAVSAWYRKFFDTEKAVPPKNQFLYGKGGTNNKFNFTTVPLVPRLVPHYRFFRRPQKFSIFRGENRLRNQVKLCS